MIQAEESNLLRFVLGLVLDGRLFPEYNRTGFFAFADVAAKSQGLPVREPQGRFVAQGEKQEHVDAAIRLLCNQVARHACSDGPRLVPGNGALRQKTNDALGDEFIDLNIHGMSFPAVQPAEAGFASV